MAFGLGETKASDEIRSKRSGIISDYFIAHLQRSKDRACMYVHGCNLQASNGFDLSHSYSITPHPLPAGQSVISISTIPISTGDSL